MKKIVAMILSVLFCIGTLSSTCFAAETSSIGNNLGSEVQPQWTEEYEYSGYAYILTGTEFTTSADGNLKLVIASNMECTVRVYREGIFGWTHLKTVSHNGTSATYTIKENAPKGTYRYELSADDFDCYVSMIFATSQTS